MDKSFRSQGLPYRTADVGTVVEIGGGSYLVVERPRGLSPRGACVGCAFRLRTCPAGWGCSKFDRTDGRFVWFVSKDR